MIRLTLAGKVLYQMLGLVVILLILYAILFLLTALHTLPHIDFAGFPFVQSLTRLTPRILDMLILTGIVTGGMVMAEARNGRALFVLLALWTFLISLTLLFGTLTITPALDLFTVGLLVAYLGMSFRQTLVTAFLRVWRVGILLIVLCLLAQPIVNDEWLQAVALWRAHVAYTVTGVSILFWLVTRWSNVREQWARDGVLIIAGLIAIAGTFISIAPLRLPLSVGGLTGAVILLCYMIFAGHCYRALRDRNTNRSLSPHWVAIAVLMWLAGGAFMGTISTQADIQTWINGTQVLTAQFWLMNWGILAIILSLVNDTATRLRGENRRVTGYMPLWLIAFGVAFAAIIQGCSGIVEIYLYRLLSIDRVTVDRLLIPLTMIELVCLLAVAMGIILYALGFRMRYPQMIVA